MSLCVFRVYLLLGMVFHKILWEVLKRRRGADGRDRRVSGHRPGVILIKSVKLAILLCILLQTMIPDIFPIASDPLPLRMLGAFVYTMGLLIAVVGRMQLDDNWDDIETARVLRKHEVVSHGLYRYIRHPIYVGDLLLLYGVEMSLNSWLILGVVLLTPIVLFKAAQEEEMLKDSLPGYAAYCAESKRFIPFVY